VGPVDRPNVRRRLVDVGRLPGVRLVVVRAGDGADQLRRQVPGAKVLGDISGVDLAHAVASYDVLVQPRKKELDCHAVRRALASGVPVVGLATGGITDVVADGVNGLLVDPDHPHALRDGVDRLLRHPDLRARLAERARDSVAVRTWADAVDELLEVHWSAVARPLAGLG
jgi:phosphatidylinositol alpha 1,6-mannosyltransferase